MNQRECLIFKLLKNSDLNYLINQNLAIYDKKIVFSDIGQKADSFLIPEICINGLFDK